MSNAEKSYFSPKGNIPKANGAYQKKAPEKDWMHAENESPEAFDGAYSTAYTTTIKLEKSVNRALSMIFSDYHGCVITPEPSSPKLLRVDLYFQPKVPTAYSDGDLERRAFIPVEEAISNPNDSNFQNMVRAATAAFRSTATKKFALTNYASEILYDFVMDDIKNTTKINPFVPESYGNHVGEAYNLVNGNNVIICGIDCIDIIKLIEFIYGSKEKDKDDKSKLFYKVGLQRPFMPNTAVGAAANWVISITKMTRNQYTKVMNELGVTTYSGSMRINTDM